MREGMSHSPGEQGIARSQLAKVFTLLMDVLDEALTEVVKAYILRDSP
jgi:hypothetical protein